MCCDFDEVGFCGHMMATGGTMPEYREEVGTGYPKYRTATVPASDAPGLFIHTLEIKRSWWRRWETDDSKIPAVNLHRVWPPVLKED
jgi:hypothetical protein